MRKPKNNIFSELYFDQYEVSVNAKNIHYFEVEEHPLVKVICTAANTFLPIFLLPILGVSSNNIFKLFSRTILLNFAKLP